MKKKVAGETSVQRLSQWRKHFSSFNKNISLVLESEKNSFLFCESVVILRDGVTMRAIVTLMVFHLSIVFAINPAVSNNVKVENDQVIPTKPTWKEKAVEVLEEIVSEPIEAPPAKPEYTHSYWSSIKLDPKWDYGLMWWYIEKANNLSTQVNLTRNHAKNILYLIERNETASKALWETSAKSAVEARHLAEVGVNDTPVFLLNEYIVELNPANFNILNQILN